MEGANRVAEVANPRNAPQRLPQEPLLLAADVGGTHARVGLVSRRPDGASPVTVLRYQRYTCAEWPSLAAVLQHFVAYLDPPAPIEQCVVASAGYVLNDAIVNDNLAWKVSISEIRDSLALEHLAVLNDFEAVAWATQFLTDADTTPVIEASAPRRDGPVLVLGPGTGLGAAVLLPGTPHATVLATEAGQIALAPGNERERELLHLLARERDYVSYETVLSGPGLRTLYRALCTLRDSAPVLHEPDAITHAALTHSDAAAVETLKVFCGLLGSFAADLALLYGASGGVFLAGGFLPQLRELLLASDFRARFFNKGVMRPFLEQIPVRLMEHGQHGVIGAAGLAIAGHAVPG